jgi:glycosyltransferase involved in cell wall biosynthesis
MTITQRSPKKNIFPISIVLINSEDIHGGAALAVYRLYLGLKDLDLNVHMLVKNKKTINPDIISVVSCEKNLEHEQEVLSYFIHQELINKNRTDLSTTLFSYPIIGYDLESSQLVKSADIINLHWINFFCSLSSLTKIIGMKKPIVWTLHDEWLVTGGCHYTSGCNKFLDKCINCPQLIDDSIGLPHHFLEKKRELIKQMNPIIVTPSHWLAGIVRQSPIFKDIVVEVIPNSVDISVYRDIPKNIARKRFGLPNEGFYLLFNVNGAFEKRKGMHLLITALKYCLKDPVIAKKIFSGEIKIICFGDQGNCINYENIPIICLGRIESESDLCLVYSLADVFLLPSIEDNLPNVVIEAMSCGTPTIAFNVGGIPDMIQHGINGYIVENLSESDYAAGISNLVNNPKLCQDMSVNCRKIAIDTYSLEIQARRYLELFNRIISSNNMKNSENTTLSIQESYELLPDASDISNDEKIAKIIRETDQNVLIINELEFLLLKASIKKDNRYKKLKDLENFLEYCILKIFIVGFKFFYRFKNLDQ